MYLNKKQAHSVKIEKEKKDNKQKKLKNSARINNRIEQKERTIIRDRNRFKTLCNEDVEEEV